MKNTILLLNGLWLLGLVACQPKSSSLSECPIVNVRSALQKETPISMKEDVVSIQYIPLETTDSCLISNLLNLQVTRITCLCITERLKKCCNLIERVSSYVGSAAREMGRESIV